MLTSTLNTMVKEIESNFLLEIVIFKLKKCFLNKKNLKNVKYMLYYNSSLPPLLLIFFLRRNFGLPELFYFKIRKVNTQKKKTASFL